MTTTAFDAGQFDDGYPPGIEDNWWCVARSRVIEAEMSARLPRDARILEIGCGPGMVVGHLRAAGWNVTGCDLGTPRPIAGTEPYLTLGTAAEDLPAPARAQVDCVLLLDVIEHVEDPVPFLRGVLAALPNARTFIVTVPARPEAWSAHDTHYGHFRRYLPETLAAELTGAGLRGVRSRYFFHSLYLAAMAINRLGIARRVERGAPKQTLKFGHAAVAGALRLEDALLRRTSLPGLSLLAVAFRQATSTTPSSCSVSPLVAG